MQQHEAEQVIDALETGRQFEFSNYHAGERELLSYETAEGRFVHNTQYAYEPGQDERRLFTREEFAAHLREHFSYRSFDLPPAERCRARRKGRGLCIESRSDGPDISGEPFYWIELTYGGIVYKGNDLSELLANLRQIETALRDGRALPLVRTSAGSPAAVPEALPSPPGASVAERLTSVRRMIAAVEQRIRA